jgi:broad specificity phosphatase PhoE
MFTRTIYFVRHGETILNAERVRQGEAGGLSENGHAQAFALGERLSKFNIKNIFCSPFQRAMETADEILKSCPVNIEYSPLLGERKNPTRIVGLSYDDPITEEAIGFMDKSYHTPEARWEDEENFEDLRDRAIKLKEFLIKNSSDKTLCVSHGIFIKMFLCTLLYDKDLSVEKYIKMSMFNPADNAGITIIKYSPLNFFGNPWEIIAYNDSVIDMKSLTI